MFAECFATIESVKAASDLYMPVAAKIIEVNKALVESPALINESPLDKGIVHLFEIVRYCVVRDAFLFTVHGRLAAG